MGAKQQEIPAKFDSDWIESLDKRTRMAAVIQDRLHALETDLGGREALSYQMRSLCKRAIWMEAVIEQQEAALARGEDVDQGRLTQAVNSLIGLLKTLGLARQTRDVVSLTEYVKRKGKA